MEYIKAFHNLLFPSENLCFVCKTRFEKIEKFVCRDCRDNLEILNKEILMHSVYIEKSYYSLMYNRLMREIIRDFKFHGKSYLYKPLGEIMVNTYKEVGIKGDAIFFIPSHKRKEAKRGFNQSELLAKYISKSIKIPISHNNLIKTKHTRDQNKLDRIERLLNLKNSFKIRNSQSVIDKNIILIDDIITTGSTMEEVAKTLVEAGANQIIGLALTSSKKI